MSQMACLLLEVFEERGFDVEERIPSNMWSWISNSIEGNAPHKFLKALKAVCKGHHNLNYKNKAPTVKQSTLLQNAVNTLCRPDYAPRKGFENDVYLYARMLLKHGATLQTDFYTGDPAIRGDPPMHIAMRNDNAGLVVFFMKYGCRLAHSDLLLAVQNTAEQSCIALLEWGAFIPTSGEQDGHNLFYVAAQHHLFGLMRIMIYNNPQYLQQDWVLKNKPPICRTTPKPQLAQFWAWMQKQRKQPADLQHLCRKTILGQIAMQCLPPDSTSQPLLMEDEDTLLELMLVKKRTKECIKQPVFKHALLSAAIDELPLPKGLKEILQIPDLQKAMEDTGINDYTVLKKQ